jgi:hypothetical protein
MEIEDIYNKKMLEIYSNIRPPRLTVAFSGVAISRIVVRQNKRLEVSKLRTKPEKTVFAIHYITLRRFIGLHVMLK